MMEAESRIVNCGWKRGENLLMIMFMCGFVK